MRKNSVETQKETANFRENQGLHRIGGISPGICSTNKSLQVKGGMWVGVVGGGEGRMKGISGHRQ